LPTILNTLSLIQYPKYTIFANYPRYNIFANYPRYTIFANYPRYTILDTLSLPIILDTLSLPTILDTLSLPIILDTLSLPTILDTISLPTILDTLSLPIILDTISLPTILDTLSLPSSSPTTMYRFSLHETTIEKPAALESVEKAEMTVESIQRARDNSYLKLDKVDPKTLTPQQLLERLAFLEDAVECLDGYVNNAMASIKELVEENRYLKNDMAEANKAIIKKLEDQVD
jgi:hypothetical protein